MVRYFRFNNIEEALQILNLKDQEEGMVTRIQTDGIYKEIAA